MDDDRGRRAVADALPLRRRPDGDGGDEIPAFRVNTYRVEAVLGLRLPASGDEPEHDDQHEDDDRVDEDGDEAESYACVFHGARGG